MFQPVCFTCRIRNQVARLGERRSSVSGVHEAADPACDEHLAEVELPGWVARLSREVRVGDASR